MNPKQLLLVNLVSEEPVADIDDSEDNGYHEEHHVKYLVHVLSLLLVGRLSLLIQLSNYSFILGVLQLISIV